MISYAGGKLFVYDEKNPSKSYPIQELDADELTRHEEDPTLSIYTPMAPIPSGINEDGQPKTHKDWFGLEYTMRSNMFVGDKMFNNSGDFRWTRLTIEFMFKHMDACRAKLTKQNRSALWDAYMHNGKFKFPNDKILVILHWDPDFNRWLYSGKYLHFHPNHVTQVFYLRGPLLYFIGTQAEAVFHVQTLQFRKGRRLVL